MILVDNSSSYQFIHLNTKFLLEQQMKLGKIDKNPM